MNFIIENDFELSLKYNLIIKTKILIPKTPIYFIIRRNNLYFDIE